MPIDWTMSDWLREANVLCTTVLAENYVDLLNSEHVKVAEATYRDLCILASFSYKHKPEEIEVSTRAS